jgi:hypothetical protein
MISVVLASVRHVGVQRQPRSSRRHPSQKDAPLVAGVRKQAFSVLMQTTNVSRELLRMVMHRFVW